MKRLSVGGISGFICFKGKKERDMTLVRSLDIRVAVLILVTHCRVKRISYASL